MLLTSFPFGRFSLITSFTFFINDLSSEDILDKNDIDVIQDNKDIDKSDDFER